jgi:predicted amidophosphoribosyltransferase
MKHALKTLLIFIGNDCLLDNERLLTSILLMYHMKIVCPDCKAPAELSDDFAFVKCPNCSLDMTYGEYVRYVAYKDKRYRDILSDYKL